MIKSDINDVSYNSILEARDDSFFEDIFSFKTRIFRSLVCEPPSSRFIKVKFKIEIELKRSKRNRFEKNFGEEFFTYLVEGDPCTYDETISSSDLSYWKKVINSEIQSIRKN